MSPGQSRTRFDQTTLRQNPSRKAGMHMIRTLYALTLVSLLTISTVGCATTSQITSGNSNMCMNVVNHGFPEPGAPVIMKVCDPWKNQQWSFNGNGQITGVGGFC